MFLNISGRTKSLKNKFHEYVPVSANEIVSEEVIPNVKSSSSFKKINAIDCITNVNKICLKRGHALGDVLMLTPIVNYLRSLGKHVDICTNSRYKIEGVPGFVTSHDVIAGNYDLVINLDWVLELDHYDDNLFSVNRVDIYRKYLSLPDIGNDWTFAIPEVNVEEEAQIGVQVTGSQSFKSVDLDPVFEALTQNNTDYYVIGKKPGGMKNNISLLTLLNIFKKLKGIICFDSGPLWMTHITNTPAFVIVGPTSGEKVTKRHPNALTTFYDTKKDGKCKLEHGCGEDARDCKGKFKCMKKVKHKKLNKELINWVNKL